MPTGAAHAAPSHIALSRHNSKGSSAVKFKLAEPSRAVFGCEGEIHFVLPYRIPAISSVKLICGGSIVVGLGMGRDG
jgi:hypothetical protein